MGGIGALMLWIGLLMATAAAAESQELPTVLTCTSNAKASRDYGFSEQRWSGQVGHLVEPSRLFSTSDRSSKTSWGQFELRDKVFSGLNTREPTVRSITRFEKGPEQGAEFVGRVVSRTSDAVFIVWSNASPDPFASSSGTRERAAPAAIAANKVWLAAVDLTHRKVTVTYVFQGVTSIGGEVETLDCR
ncbi:MAG: hypothetical protein KIT09_30020 [Bryobacteraceae bacterium]|nr:hypothetical protein [Bryobacteraceae bacterium]